jgi:hypothetical protein
VYNAIADASKAGKEMAKVQFTITDEDRARFIKQARIEGMTLSAWLRAAAQEHLAKQQPAKLDDYVLDESVNDKGYLVDLTPFFQGFPPMPEVGDKEGWGEYFERLEGQPRPKPIESYEEATAFFEELNKNRGPKVALDWEEEKAAINESRLRGLPKT